MVNSSHNDVGSQTEPTLPIGKAARLLGVSVITLRRYENAGRIKSVRTPGGQRRFTIASIEELRGASQEAVR